MYTRQHSRARIPGSWAPGTCAAALARRERGPRVGHSDFLCAEGQDATSSCVPVSEVPQGPFCGASCASELQGFEGIPDGTGVTVYLALQQGAEMTDEMCTAACAISEASCMENPGNPVFTCLGAIDGPSAPVPVPAPEELHGSG